jgi:ribosomal protein S18 acetylase RimI-like enzyme
VTVRAATGADEAVLRDLWKEFEAEVPEPAGFVSHTWEDVWPSFRNEIAAGSVFVAEDGDGPLGFANAAPEGSARWRLDTIYVRPRARRAGVAKALVAAIAGAAGGGGARHLTLEVLETNEAARAVWGRLGFASYSRVLAQPLDALEARLAAAPDGASRASTHVQSDDRVSVDRTLAQFVPRLEAVAIENAADGWIRIAAPLLDSDRSAQSKLARELSERLGAVCVAVALEHGAVVRFLLFERGRMVDEYLSVPTFYGPIPKGDELALEANPTLVARLTGADRELVRRTARTAAEPADLPPAGELYEQIARMMGLEP